jgi:hypothetical protein
VAEATAKASDIARRQGKRAAEIQAAAAREKHGTDHPLVRCHPVLGVVNPDLNVRYADHHAFAIWRPHVLDPKDASKGNGWSTSDKMGWGHREDVESLSGRPFELMPDAVHGTPDLLVLDDGVICFATRRVRRAGTRRRTFRRPHGSCSSSQSRSPEARSGKG